MTENLNINPPSVTGITLPTTTTAVTPTIPQTRYFTEDEVERIRQQEKDKMYSRLQKNEEQLNEFRSTVESLMSDKKARDEELAAQRKAAEDEARRLSQEKLSTQQLLEQSKAEFETQQKKLREDMELQITVMKREQEFLKMRAFIQNRINEEVNAATIIPDLAEYITGDTEEEVEASIQRAKDKTNSILNGVQSLTQPTSPMGTSPTGTPFSPLDRLSNNRPLTQQQIAAMNNSEFAVYRKQIGLDRAGSGQGMFS